MTVYCKYNGQAKIVCRDRECSNNAFICFDGVSGLCKCIRFHEKCSIRPLTQIQNQIEKGNTLKVVLDPIENIFELIEKLLKEQKQNFSKYKKKLGLKKTQSNTPIINLSEYKSLTGKIFDKLYSETEKITDKYEIGNISINIVKAQSLIQKLKIILRSLYTFKWTDKQEQDALDMDKSSVREKSRRGRPCSVKPIRQTINRQIISIHEQKQLHWSLTLKSHTIQIQGEMAKQLMTSKNAQNTLILLQPVLGDYNSWDIQVTSLKGEIIFGVCMRSIVEKNHFGLPKYNKVGHGGYLMAQDGITYSNHESSSNYKHSVPLATRVGDIFTMKFYRNQSNLEIYRNNVRIHLMAVKIVKGEEYYPCIYLGFKDDQVRLLKKKPTFVKHEQPTQS